MTPADGKGMPHDSPPPIGADGLIRPTGLLVDAILSPDNADRFRRLVADFGRVRSSITSEATAWWASHPADNFDRYRTEMGPGARIYRQSLSQESRAVFTAAGYTCERDDLILFRTVDDIPTGVFSELSRWMVQQLAAQFGVPILRRAAWTPPTPDMLSGWLLAPLHAGTCWSS